MDNPLKGEISFNALGEVWTLRFNTAAWVMAENEIGKPWSEIFDLLSGKGDPVSMGQALALLHAGLLDNHANLKRDQAFQIFDKIGYGHAVTKIAQAVAISFQHHTTLPGDDEKKSETPTP